MTKPVILFFVRGYQAEYFPTLVSDRYDAVFVALQHEERVAVEARGAKVAACFEDDFESLIPAEVPSDYLIKSFPADRFLGRFDAKKRLEILGKEIAFWRTLLERHKPTAVVNELVALEISEVLLVECRRQGITYLAGMNCVVDSMFYWLRNPMTLAGEYLHLPEPNAAARVEAEAYVQAVLEKDHRPFYAQNLSGRRALRPLLAGIVKLLLWRVRQALADRGRFRYELYTEEYAKRIELYCRSLFGKYDSLDKLPQDFEVVYYPLHLEPEATLNYMSEFYANQAATIENILRCLTPHQVLVVKEHPGDKGALLLPKFQRLCREYSSLYFLPAEVPGRQVIVRAGRVVTLTSTSAWEAAIMGRTAYVLGEIFYDSLPGLKRVNGFAELRDRLRAPAGGASVTREQVVDFVARMVTASYVGNPFPHPKLYDEANRQRVIHAICDGAGI